MAGGSHAPDDESFFHDDVTAGGHDRRAARFHRRTSFDNSGATETLKGPPHNFDVLLRHRLRFEARGFDRATLIEIGMADFQRRLVVVSVSSPHEAEHHDDQKTIATTMIVIVTGTMARGGDDLHAFFRVVTAGYTLIYSTAAILKHWNARDYQSLRRQAYGYRTGLAAYLIKTSDFLAELESLERREMLAGPLTYLPSRRQAR